ncbi:alanine racemase [Candidatus Peregrinibacteria bacterium]|nr:alanine racemase [Candidatus Peregrinibacteria bacterium]
MDLTWVEISEPALVHNLKMFRKLVGKEVVLAPAVKANAYGHGLTECARIFEENGADYLCVNALFEAKILRKAGIRIPLLIIGYTPLSDLTDLPVNTELVVYNLETVKKLGKIGKKVGIHLKIETGNHRQGIELSDLPDFIRQVQQHPHLILKGVSTHFANLEDRINHEYALYQLKEFNKAVHLLEKSGHAPHYRHCANTAATILLPEAYFNFVRTGIGNYGLWPSDKTEQAAKRAGIDITLKPALTWKTVVAQVKEVKQGALIGYGCTYEMPHSGRIAIIPVGYYDGFVRLLSNRGAVLIRGKKAPVIGRVCMNMIMVDITDIPGVKLEDEVVLLGCQGKEHITAEEIAEQSQTINYEVTTRINERIPRIYM